MLVNDQQQWTFFASQIVSMTVTMICFNANHNNALNLRKTTGQQVLLSTLERQFNKEQNHNSTKSTGGLEMDQIACFLGLKTSNAGLFI
jgi:hypothetical protein